MVCNAIRISMLITRHIRGEWSSSNASNAGKNMARLPSIVTCRKSPRHGRFAPRRTCVACEAYAAHEFAKRNSTSRSKPPTAPVVTGQASWCCTTIKDAINHGKAGWISWITVEKQGVTLRGIWGRFGTKERNRSGLLCAKYNPSVTGMLRRKELGDRIRFGKALSLTFYSLPGWVNTPRSDTCSDFTKVTGRKNVDDWPGIIVRNILQRCAIPSRK